MNYLLWAAGLEIIITIRIIMFIFLYCIKMSIACSVFQARFSIYFVYFFFFKKEEEKEEKDNSQMKEFHLRHPGAGFWGWAHILIEGMLAVSGS